MTATAGPRSAPRPREFSTRAKSAAGACRRREEEQRWRNAPFACRSRPCAAAGAPRRPASTAGAVTTPSHGVGGWDSWRHVDNMETPSASSWHTRVRGAGHPLAPLSLSLGRVLPAAAVPLSSRSVGRAVRPVDRYGIPVRRAAAVVRTNPPGGGARANRHGKPAATRPAPRRLRSRRTFEQAEEKSRRISEREVVAGPVRTGPVRVDDKGRRATGSSRTTMTPAGRLRFSQA